MANRRIDVKEERAAHRRRLAAPRRAARSGDPESVALRKHRAAGFAAWLVGNAAWVWYAVLTHSLYLGVQFGIFWMLAVAGLLNNLRDSRGGPDVVERHC